MATTVYVPLNPLPAGVTGYYRERHPYGPTAAGGFESGLGVEIDPAHLDPYAGVLAAVSGLARVIPNKAGAGPVDVVLRPDLGAATDLGAELGCGNVVFLYRNLDPATVRAAALPAITALPEGDLFGGATTEQRANRYMAGAFGVAVKAAAKIGALAAPAQGDWARLDVEIALLPAGLGMTGAGPAGADLAASWARLVELTAPAATTRRLDPVSFYARATVAGAKIALAPGHVSHAALTTATRRTLIEVRDEYDEPFTGTVTITGGTGVTGTAPAGSRGTFVLDAVTGEGPTQQVAYQVSVAESRLTELPSGAAATATPAKTLAAPAQWALQSIVVSLAPPVAVEAASWLVANAGGLPRFTEGNRVTPIRDGVDLFHDYDTGLRTATGAGHFVYFTGWRLIDSFQLREGDATSTIAALSTAAATGGAQVRALLWDQAFSANSDEVNHFNALPSGNGKAILDNDTLNIGAHHQKSVVVNGTGGLVAWAGGIDINTDRRDTSKHGAEGGFHDIHAKVEGPAVGDLATTFVQRWNAHPSHPTPLPAAGALVRQNAGSHFVQIARTYPPQKAYSFAPAGSLVPRDAVVRAVNRARKYIYIEDQYLTPYPGTDPAGAGDGVGVLTALRAALARIDYLVILIPNHSDQPQNRYRRQQFIHALRDAAPAKVFVFFLARPTPTHPDADEVGTEGGGDSSSGGKNYRGEIYIHSKVWIVDDVIAKIGSANMNRRGYTHDSELDVIVLDGAVRDGARVYARDLRTELWGEHLNMTGAKTALLEDYKAALGYWRTPPKGARIRPYLEDTEIDKVNTQTSWDSAVDPDGR